jgi:hypothetical protein
MGYLKKLFLPTDQIEDAYWTVGVTELDIQEASNGSIRLSLESYCPNRTGYEVAFDEGRWELVKGETSVRWILHHGRNTLRLRTVNRGDIRGPETTLLLKLN